MIDELDETLRKLLAHELALQESDIDVAFSAPTRAWATTLTKPTLNLFLYDIRENAKMRQMAQQYFERGLATAHIKGKNGKTAEIQIPSTSRKQVPLRVDLHYMITAWAGDPSDEHRMLARTMIAFFRHLTIPDDLRALRDPAYEASLEPLPDNSPDHLLPAFVRAVNLPVNLQLMQEEGLAKPTELWSALDNELRPAVNLIMTAPLDPYTPFDTPIVRTAQFTYMQKGREVPASQRVYRDAVPNAQSYPRDENDTERLNQPKQNVDGRAFTQVPTALTANVFVRGFIRRKNSSAPLQNVQAVLLEHQHGNPEGGSVEVRPDGTFTLFGLPAQTYTLMISADGLASFKHAFTVPLPDPAAELKIEV